MSGAPETPALASLRHATDDEVDAVRAVWELSHQLDDPAGRPSGGWSVNPWATDTRVLEVDHRIVGIAAVRAEPAHAAVVAAQVALEPAHRTSELANLLVQACLELACRARGDRVRVFCGARARWTTDAVRGAGFACVRAIYHMLLAQTLEVPDPRPIDGITFRTMLTGEEPQILAALNRAWLGTWDFVPIRPEMLAEDLAGQREGMLLALHHGQIVATCHAVFDPAERGPDGDPRAWISNLTVDPDYRGRGLARSMLLTGLHHLRARGAGSITLGVDAGDPAPLTLYQSVGFVEISTVEAWDKPLTSHA